MFCLDTNVMVDFFRGDVALKEKLPLLRPVCITPIALAELFKGAYVSRKQEESLRFVIDLERSVELLPFDALACSIFGYQYLHLKKQGKLTQDADLMIASIVLAQNAILVTRNKKDFANIKGLKVLSL